MIKGRNHSTLLIVTTIFLLTFAATACNTANEESPLSLLDESGQHPAGWTEAHGSFASPDGSSCTSCHGAGLDGGISNVSCSSASFNGQSCHAGGPAFHSAGWLDKQAGEFHGLTYQADPTACYSCHDPNDPLTSPGYSCLECHFSEDGTQRVPSGSGYSHGDSGTSHSQFNGTADGDVCTNCHAVNISFSYEPACHNCHGENHDVPFLDHTQAAPSQADFTNNCSRCHSATGQQPDQSARRCDDCHTSGNPYTLTNCRSCHGNPPGGSSYPNRDGRHGGDHNYVCSECHSPEGSGSGLNHYEPTQAHLSMPLSFTQTPSQVTCNGTCHGEGHSNRRWY